MKKINENHSWKLYPIIKTFRVYFRCSFYKTLLFSIILYPLSFILNLSEEKIRRRKNNILSKEIKRYIIQKYNIKIVSLEGSFALGGLLEVFSKKLYDLFKISQKDIIYDVGATVGEYSLKCARNRAEVLAFELERSSYNSMIKNIQANNFENRIIPFNCRVDSKENSLDNFFYKTKKIPTLMKIDIEGDERIALEGAKNILRKYKPRIILETHSKELEENCINFLKLREYKIVNKLHMKSKNREVKLFFLE